MDLKIGCCLLLDRTTPIPGDRRCCAVAALGVALTVGDYNTGIVVAVFVIALYAVGSYATTARFVGALVGVGVVMGVVAWSDPPDLARPARCGWR